MCDARSLDRRQWHPIQNAIDGSNRWWQSPTLTNGYKYNYITITLDLHQVYQVAYVIVKAANAPRPGNWILEKSIDGENFTPWQYFGITRSDCLREYGLPDTDTIPNYLTDDQVICTTTYSKITPLEDGEIFVSLVNGRPGVNRPSSALLQFTSARYVRLRFQKIRTLHDDLISLRAKFNDKFKDPSVTERYFYSIKDISIGGQCICYGHAGNCRPIKNTDRLSCECTRNTCGNNCETCCPGFNQKKWQPGHIGEGCEACNCHRHATDCVYNATVDAQRLSLNIKGEYSGGGVCLNCQDYTTGINCEKCIDGYYRPLGMAQTSQYPCRQCRCRETQTSTDQCYPDDSRVQQGHQPGDCICKPGFGGSQCNQCAFGYDGYPYCKPCPCNAAGSVDPSRCDGSCICKLNVEGPTCGQCKQGYYNLDRDSSDGCRKCFCFGISTVCQSSDLGLVKISHLEGGMSGWTVTTLNIDGFTLFVQPNSQGWLEYLSTPAASQNSLDPVSDVIYYWQSTIKYLGNRLTSYGGTLEYVLHYDLDTTLHNTARHIYDINVIIQGSNITIASGKGYVRENYDHTERLVLTENNWYRMREGARFLELEPVSKQDFMTVLYNIDRLLIRATYHQGQKTLFLKSVTLDTVSASSNSSLTLPSVEKCTCPRGYHGLSCESCEPGYRRVDDIIYGGRCLPCECHQHADKCDPNTGKCLNCQDHTTGDRCDKCLPGYYGNPRHGTPMDCKACACPSTDPRNNFATTCEWAPVILNDDNYHCLDCREGHIGVHCELCGPGYYGDPLIPGGYCRPCQCNENIDLNDPDSCDSMSGKCLKCLNHAEGERCSVCREGFFGTAIKGDCTACNCDRSGSATVSCDRYTGQCQCKENFGGRKCDLCKDNHWGLPLGVGCKHCDCNLVGSRYRQCDRVTGQCPCRAGIGGDKCDKCNPGYYGFSQYGCQKCQPCTKPGYICDPVTGECRCPPNTTGVQCERCAPNTWDYHPVEGCKQCNCNSRSSLSQQCDLRTGKCKCLPDYNGDKCDSCLFGFYGYPNCLLCLCSADGTNKTSCNSDGQCQCDDRTGQCQCKKNVQGKDCSQCKPNTFSFDPGNPDGCTECFCYDRSSQCQQSNYVWSQRIFPNRTVSLDNRVNNFVTRKHKYYNVIPHDTTWMAVPAGTPSGPLYWSLSKTFLGDLTLSYNGYISYTISDGSRLPVSTVSPQIIIIGNGFQLLYTGNTSDQKHRVRLHESYWRALEFTRPATRKLLMVVLQNVTDILLLASHDQNSPSLSISSITLDVAVPANESTSSKLALGIESCQCPSKYSGLSCQDPSDGYYRIRINITIDISDPIVVIGKIQPCDCHGHAQSCDKETGVCQNCAHNTTGKFCELCAPGFYGDGSRGSPFDCQPCACPLITNNFSPSCEVTSGQLLCTNCSQGYVGRRCESCADGYYGNPRISGGMCRPCGCNPEGSFSSRCDNEGRCVCLSGISGEKCDQCQPRHAVENGVCISCDEGCTRDLMAELDKLDNTTLAVNITGIIPAPWDRLWKIKNETTELEELLDKMEFAEILHLENQTKQVQQMAETLLAKSMRALTKAENIQTDASILRKNGTELADQIEDLLQKLKDELGKLEELVKNLYNNQSGVNITAALEEAQKILKEIEGRDMSRKMSEAFNESMLAEKLSERVLQMRYRLINGTDEVKKRLEDISRRLQDLQEQSLKSEDKSNEADNVNFNLLINLKQLQDMIYDIEIHSDKTTVALGIGHELNLLSWNALNQTKTNIKHLEREASKMDVVLPRLQQTIDEYRKQIPDAENYTKLALDHAEKLLDQAEILEKMFEKTKADAEIPLKAAKVYSTIVQAVEEAEKAAKDALNTSRNTIELAGVENIKNDVNSSLERSKQLLARANELKNKTSGLDNHLKTLKDDVNKVNDTQRRIGNGLKDLQNGLNSLPKGIPERLRRVTDDLALLDDKLLTTEDEVNKIKGQMDNNLWPKYKEMKDFSVDDIVYDVQSSIYTAKRNIQNMKDIIDEVEVAKNNTKAAESAMVKNLAELKDNIAKARAQAAKVKVSLMSEGKCARSYRNKFKQAATNSIKFSFKTDEVSRDMLLFLVQSTTRDYLSVELRKGTIRFGWNVGDGPAFVDSRLEVKPQNPDVAEANRWYHVEALRIQNLGILRVAKNNGSSALVPVEDRAVSSGIRSTLKLDDTSQLFVSGTPIDHFRPPVTNGNFTGCMGELYFDDNRIGLHEFKTSSPFCDGCIEVPVFKSSATTFHFQGTGYAAISKIPDYNSREFQITFYFKTFWANSTLLFAGNPVNEDFYYVGLENKKVVFQLYTGGVTYCRMETQLEYNDNKWHYFLADRIDLIAVLKVGNESIMCQAPGTNHGLDILGNKFYFGGYPDTIDTSKFRKRATFVDTKFLGCLRDIQYQGSKNRVDLLQEEIIAVEPGCPQEAYRIIGFYGNGYAQYNAKPLPKESGGITLSFRTMKSNALLLLARDLDDENYYTLALTDGRIEGRFSSNSIPEIITSKKQYNDGKTHTIGVLKKNRKITLYVDDIYCGEKELPVGTDTIDVTQLYLGGVLLTISQDLAPTFEGLYGCINDVVINGDILNLNTDIYENADIGRCSIPEPPEDTSQNLFISTTQQTRPPSKRPVSTTSKTTITTPRPTTPRTESCAFMPPLAVDPYTLTFGDEDGDSFGEINNIAKNNINVRFNISFEFRTFHPKGTFFYISNPDDVNGDYVACQIYNGFVMVFFQYDGNLYSLNSTIGTSDGYWHSVEVLKGTKNIRLTVDKIQRKEAIKRKLNIDSPVFVGGVTDRLVQHPELVQHSVRGCLRNYYINNQLILIKDAKIVKGVTKCYVNVEPGVYVTGPGYGIIGNDFIVGRRMEINFEFRTQKPEGIILSISNGQLGPSVTIELYNGKVKFSVFNQDLYSAVSQNSEFALCDSQWHDVRAEVVGNVIKLQVDGSDGLYGVSGAADTDIDTSAPLFIGGLPDLSTKPNTALSSSGFEGCLRNFVINGVPVDWFNLNYAYDIRKTDCPF